jgi:signal transduction histidine kinase
VYLQQKEFIENASHELQTPISIFQSKLDELMQSPLLASREAETIMELEATAQRMARLNRNLLLLSKIENEQFLNTEVIDLSDLINSQLSVLRPMAQLENISIVTSIQSLHLRTNPTLIEVLLTNLFHNAIRYSPNNEEIRVSLQDQVLTVSNKGTPLKLDVSKMTDRFAKGSTDPGSTGLGLAIVRKICDRYLYDLKYAYANHAHNFIIYF